MGSPLFPLSPRPRTWKRLLGLFSTKSGYTGDEVEGKSLSNEMGAGKMTLIQKIKAGEVPEIVTKEASFERVNLNTLLEHIVRGKVVIPQNIGRTLASPAGIGKGLSTKINAKLGTSAA